MDFEASGQEIAAAQAYQDLHVPALFGQWPPHVARAVGVQPGQRVLDVACGTGVLAQYVSSIVGDAGYVAGVDTGKGMLAVARRLAPSIDWRHGLAEAIPFESASFDAVVSQFGLMFFPDRPAALREMRRVVEPGGRLGIAVWGGLEKAQAYKVAVDLLQDLAGDAAAQALRVPFSLGDDDELIALLNDAGLVGVCVETPIGKARFPRIRTMMEAELRGWLPLMGVHLEEALVQTVLREADQALAHYVLPDGTVEFDVPAHIAIGTRAA